MTSKSPLGALALPRSTRGIKITPQTFDAAAESCGIPSQVLYRAWLDDRKPRDVDGWLAYFLNTEAGFCQETGMIPVEVGAM